MDEAICPKGICARCKKPGNLAQTDRSDRTYPLTYTVHRDEPPRRITYFHGKPTGLASRLCQTTISHRPLKKSREEQQTKRGPGRPRKSPDSSFYSNLTPEQMKLVKKYKIKPYVSPAHRPIVTCKKDGCGILGTLYTREKDGRIRTRIIHFNLPPVGVSRKRFVYPEHDYEATKEEKELMQQQTKENITKVNQARQLQRQNSITEYAESKGNVDYKVLYQEMEAKYQQSEKEKESIEGNNGGVP